MADLPVELRAALADRLSGEPGDRLRAAVVRLMAAYRPAAAGTGTGPSASRAGRVDTEPILSGPAEIAAYAAYRMPATYAAVRASIDAVSRALPSFEPTSLIDVGGGTGAAAWAAVDVYSSMDRITVLDRVDGALRLGASLGAAAQSRALRDAEWRRVLLPTDVPAADLVTVSYVLGELSDDVRRDLVDRAVGAGGAVVIVEPGTPAGYARILEARDRLIERGHRVVAPCPHQMACPLRAGDWCHFGARVNRSALHRRVKDVELSYEDEKYAYVASVPAGLAPSASRTAESAGTDERAARTDERGAGAYEGTGTDGATGRVLRRPTQRKGLVSLRLCTPDGTAVERVVTKRNGDLYRAARRSAWGDLFPE